MMKPIISTERAMFISKFLELMRCNYLKFLVCLKALLIDNINVFNRQLNY